MGRKGREIKRRGAGEVHERARWSMKRRDQRKEEQEEGEPEEGGVGDGKHMGGGGQRKGGMG